MSEHQGFEPPAPDGAPPPAAAGTSGFFADPRRRVAAIVAAALAVGALAGVGLATLAGDDDTSEEGLVADTATPTPSVSTLPSETASPTPTTTPSASPSASASASASPTASTSATAGPSGSASPSASPSATAPAVSPVTMSFTLDRNSLVVGQQVRAKVTVNNPTDKPITILGDCRNTRLATVEAQLGRSPAAPTALTGRLKAFRDRALEAVPGPVPFESGLGTCPNGVDPTPFTLAPFQSVTDPAVWNASSVNGSAYDGDVVVTVSVTYRTVDKPNVGVVLTAPTRTLRLTGGDPARLTPAQAVEKALADPELATAVIASDPALWPTAGNGFVEYFGKTGTYREEGREEYEVYLVTGRDGATESGTSVTVNRDTGTVGDLTPFSRPATG